jgi:hypothetical protein
MNLSSFIWSAADLLRGRYRPHEYGQVILPFTVLRRMDCVLEPTKQAVLKEATKREPSGTSVNPFLTRASGATFVEVCARAAPANSVVIRQKASFRQSVIRILHFFGARIARILRS